MTSHLKKFLLKLSRQTLKAYFANQLNDNFYQTIEQKIKNSFLKEKRGTFVTLTDISGNLRGCIGHLKPVQVLWRDIIDNTLSSAFSDPRFMPLTENELERIKVEISILSPLKKLDYQNTNDLLKKLRPGKDGVLIKSGLNRATFLPQVWQKVKSKEEFLEHLCLKAGLDKQEWHQGSLKVWLYGVEEIKE